jgi:hypothetical protein
VCTGSNKCAFLFSTNVRHTTNSSLKYHSKHGLTAVVRGTLQLVCRYRPPSTESECYRHSRCNDIKAPMESPVLRRTTFPRRFSPDCPSNTVSGMLLPECAVGTLFLVPYGDLTVYLVMFALSISNLHPISTHEEQESQETAAESSRPNISVRAHDHNSIASCSSHPPSSARDKLAPTSLHANQYLAPRAENLGFGRHNILSPPTLEAAASCNIVSVP